ncbi:hypothetical protein [Nocardia jinanensis]|nr:hypothetical protein [Nocardia jinanensis]
MLMDIAAVQGIAGELRGSAGEINAAALRAADCLRGFESSDAGRDYRTTGERLGQGLADISRYLFSWANCVNDCGTALRASADSCAGVDQATATNLGAVAGVFE